MKRLADFFFFLLILNSVSAQGTLEEFDLNTGWTLKQENTEKIYRATVPGVVQMDLLREKVIPDPFIGTNEQKVQWVSEKAWIYSKKFTKNDSWEARKNLVLRFDGLDTYAEVFLNDSLILSADNMFRSWEVNIKGLLKKTNTLTIRFEPIEEVLSPKVDELKYHLPAPNDQGNKKISVHARKAPFHFGWDWGPRILSVGIWKGVKLISFDDTRYLSHQFRLDSLTEKKAFYTFLLETEVHQQGTYSIDLSSGDNLILNETISLNEGAEFQQLPFTIDNPELWWPNGHGKAHLYPMEISMKRNGNTDWVQPCSLGIREIKLIREKDSIGQSFFFKVNGEPIFMKGANYIPSDALLPRIKKSSLYHDVLFAQQANMNMLRVWGGGIYQPDDFYSFCDEMGILVWQDFMFACSMYPGDEKYIQNVTQEAQEVVKRLSSHPSIALWCGNNEVEVAWNNWGWQKEHAFSKKNERKIWSHYETLFLETLPHQVQQFGNETDYISTSPLSNWGKMENFDNHNMHYWGVWHGDDSFSEYKKYVPRFMSEFGFQSFPELSTVSKFAEPSNYDLKDEVMMAHQKSYRGYKLLSRHLEEHYSTPKNFESFLYISQLLQAKGMEIAWKAHISDRARCMGSLYWQFNDCWPGPSWSGIDYYKNWKKTHFSAQKLFHPNAVFSILEKDNSRVVILNDRLDVFEGSIQVILMDFEGNIISKGNKPIRIEANTTKDIKLKEFLGPDFDEASNESLLWSKLSSEGVKISEDVNYFLSPKKLLLPIPNLTIQKKVTKNGIEIEVNSDKLCKDLFIHSVSEPLNFDKNFVDIIPGERVIFKAEIPSEKRERILETLEFIHLQESY